MPSKNRSTVTFHLYPDRDNDLIQWIDQAGKDNRSSTIKQVLRFALFDEPLEQHEQPIQESPQKHLDQLRMEWHTWTQELLSNLPDFIQDIVQKQISSIQVMPQQTLAAASQDESPEMTQRKKNLRKAKW